jgi:hypothetical protein
MLATLAIAVASAFIGLGRLAHPAEDRRIRPI